MNLQTRCGTARMPFITRLFAAAILSLTLASGAGAKDKDKEKDNGKVGVELSLGSPGLRVAPASLPLTANAWSEQSSHPVVRVDYYADATLIGSATAAPYAFTWSNVPAGSYTLTARALNDKGDAATSAPQPLRVDAPPTVALTAPSANAILHAPAAVTIAANAADSDGSIAQVDFHQGGTLLGTATAAPYAFSWSNVPAGTYTLTAQATDNDGAITTSAPVAVTVNAPPTASLAAPAANAVVAAPASVTITATATDSDGTIAKVDFYQGGTLLGSATAAPYAFTWTNVPAGSYTLTAKAIDNHGAATTSAPIPVTVDALPTVTLASPVANARFNAPATVMITATAADPDGTIAQVDFYQGSTLLGSATAAPYTFTWTNVPAGTYTLTAKATDNHGLAGTSAAIPVTVNAPPTVSLTGPENNRRIPAPASVTVTAAASDPDGTIAKVDFYQGGTLLGSTTTAPYAFTWANVPAGTYTLTAKATDNHGAATTSAPVTVILDAPPSVTLASPAANQRYTAPATIALTATATDADGSIARVEFYQGGTLIGSATTAPYTATWANVGEGSYSLTAKAIDNGGGETWSAAVSVVVEAGGAKVYYLHTDHLDTPRVVTDEANRVVWRHLPLNEPFGMSPPEEDPDGDGRAFTMNLRFPGQYFDRETNTNYNYFRDYDPGTGRYVQSDPIGLAGGINPYLYVNGNPIGNVDPLGLLGRGAGRGPYPPGQGPGTIPGQGAAGAIGDFLRNYQDMRDANTIGGDKYFHCKANCEASKRGKEGEQMACLISDTREWVDQNVKGDPASASAADQVANHYGRNQGASSTQSCSQICAPFRPNGLPSNY